nr:MAG TPA: hypothetical protein [Caudoviricetes sp.]
MVLNQGENKGKKMYNYPLYLPLRTILTYN